MKEEKERAEEVEETEETEEAESVPEEEAEDTGQEAKDTTEQPEVVEARKATDEVKVVLVYKSGRTMVGVQAPDCDPILTPIDGDMEAALPQVPALIKAANDKWDANPRNPKAVMPEPPPPPARSTSAPTSSASSAPKKQPSFF